MDIAEIRKRAKEIRDVAEEPAGPSEDAAGVLPVERAIPPVAAAPSGPGHKETLDVEFKAREKPKVSEDEKVSIFAAQDLGMDAGLKTGVQPQPSIVEEVEERESLKKEEATRDIEAIAFLLDNEEYAIDIRQVKEVIKVREMTDVPTAPENILGVISLRGVIIPVFNLRGKLGMPPRDAGERVIVVRDGAGLMGLLVDSVRHVVRVHEEDIEPTPSVNIINGELIRGIGRYKGGMFILLDIQKVLE